MSSSRVEGGGSRPLPSTEGEIVAEEESPIMRYVLPEVSVSIEYRWRELSCDCCDIEDALIFLVAFHIRHTPSQLEERLGTTTKFRCGSYQVIPFVFYRIPCPNDK